MLLTACLDEAHLMPIPHNLKVFLGDAFLFAIANLLNKGAPLVALPLITHHLPVTEYGRFELLVSVAMILSVTMSLSLESFVARNWGISTLEEKRECVSTMLSALAVVGALVIALMALWNAQVPRASSYEHHYRISAIFIISGGVLLAGLAVPLTALRMSKSLTKYIWVVGVDALIYFGGVIVLATFERISVLSLAVLFFTSKLASLVVSLANVNRFLSADINLSLLEAGLKYSLPLMPAVCIGMVNIQLDKFLIYIFMDDASLGSFSLAANMVSILALGILVFRQAWLPYSFEIARSSTIERSKLDFILLAYCIFFMVVALGLVIFFGSLINFVAPKEYMVEVGFLFPVLLLNSILAGGIVIVNIGTLVSGKTVWNSYGAVAGFVANLLISSFLIPSFGISGAAWGTLISTLIFVSILIWRSSLEVDVKFSQKKLWILSCSFLWLSYVLPTY